MKSNADTAKHILKKRDKPEASDEKAAHGKIAATVTDNAEPDGLAEAIEDISKHQANKDWQGAAAAWRNAHKIASADQGADDLESGNEY